MRKTEDGHWVYGIDKVYEVLFKYYNPEVSIPEPHYTFVNNIPECFKIWKNLDECINQCNYIIEMRKDYQRNSFEIL